MVVSEAMMDKTDDVVRLDTRLSGQIHRYHTWPTIGKQTIADHCWQILRIYLSIADNIDDHMILHIMFHDIGETAIGDLPYPVKSENHKLKEQLDFIEQKSRYTQLEFWGAFKSVLLTKADEKLFKDIELMEMAEFGMDQMCLGNSYGYIVADRCLHKVYDNEPCESLVLYIIRRLDLFHEQYKTMLSDNLSDWWYTGMWRARRLKQEEVNASK
jgi:5'-deoxynucleotidase YfbR-like HD superfamily hydrolase